jgi:Helix-turn-helix domain
MAELETARTAGTLADAELLADVRKLIRRVERGDQLRPRLLDITDAGRYLSMSDKGIRELIVRGELPYVQKVPGRSPYLLDLRDLDSWVEKNKRRP